MGKYLLETGTDRLLLESGDSLLIEHLPDDSEAFGLSDTGMLNFPITLVEGALQIALEGPTDALVLAETGVTLALWVDSESTALAEAVALAGTTSHVDTWSYTEQGSNAADLTHADSATLTETGVVDAGAVEIVASDTGTVADVASHTAALADLESAQVTDTGAGVAAGDGLDTVTLTEAGVVDVASANDKVGADTLTLAAEVEALLASLDDTDPLTVGEASLREPPDPVVAQEEFRAVRIEARRVLVPDDEDEVALLAAYVGWYD